MPERTLRPRLFREVTWFQLSRAVRCAFPPTINTPLALNHPAWPFRINPSRVASTTQPYSSSVLIFIGDVQLSFYCFIKIPMPRLAKGLHTKISFMGGQGYLTMPAARFFCFLPAQNVSTMLTQEEWRPGAPGHQATTWGVCRSTASGPSRCKCLIPTMMKFAQIGPS